MNGKLTAQYYPGVDMQEWISFAVESWNSLKTRMLDKSTKKKEDRMKLDDIAKV